MSYIVFARKWRPQNFDEVVGQPHITTTLKNAISGGRVAHAYLFTGPRGIGKTSTARILAKSLNCAQGPTIHPCDRCDSCKEIMASNSLDVLEIDGASNRGIDEIRSLRENVGFAPAKGGFKVYIIDEVHMLTQEAFNALLKTLEEPPRHVKFIFATTQPHKVPPTILSRCQRFDFKRIPVNDLLAKLKNIVEVEKLKVSKEALFYIARISEGSMRDAESILDQLVSFCDGRIEVDDVVSVLGKVDQELLFGLTQALIDRDARKGLGLINGLINDGRDAMQFLTEWIGHFRNLMVAKTTQNPSDLIEAPVEVIDRLLGQSKAFSMEELFYILHFLANTQAAMKRGMSGRVGLEVAVVKLARREEIVSLDEILGRLRGLEERIGKGAQVGEEPTTLPEQPAAQSSHFKQPEAEIVERVQQSPAEQTKIKEPPAEKSEGLTLSQVKDVWAEVLKKIKAEKMSTATFLVEGGPIEVKGNRIILGFPPQFSFNKEALEDRANRTLIEKALSQVLNRKVNVAFIVTEGEKEASKPVSDKSKVSPIIQSAIEIFGGEIVKEDNK